jgi:hypothetical protein
VVRAMHAHLLVGDPAKRRIRSLDEFWPRHAKCYGLVRGPARRRAAADRQHIATQAAAAPKTVRDRSAAKRTVI